MRSNCIAIIALSAALAVFGCQKRVTVASLPPTPSPPPAVSAIDQANSAFTSGNYDDAARGYENYLRIAPSGTQRDQALFQLALTYVLRPAPQADWPHASATLKQLIEEYPASQFKAPANLILSLRSELDQAAADSKQRDQRIKQLTAELEGLKKIDAGRRKRP